MGHSFYFKMLTITCLSLALVSLIISTLSPNIYAKYANTLTWNGTGQAKGQFDLPYGVAVDSTGRVFVADTLNHRIQMFQLANPCPSGTTPVVPGVCFITAWGSIGTGSGQFIVPFGVAVGSKGDVYVADTGNDRIQMFQLANPCPSGTTPVVPGVCFVLKWDVPVTGSGQFGTLAGIAVDSKGNVFVVDAHRNHIQAFQLSNPCPSGTRLVVFVYGVCFITEWGSRGNGSGQFFFPWGVAVDPSGNVFVADLGNDRIQAFQLANPCPIRTTQVVPGVCYVVGRSTGNPLGVGVDSSGNVFVSDVGNYRIHKFKFINSGTIGPKFPSITDWGSYGKGSDQFLYPSGVAVNSKGDVFVADPDNNRIQKFIDDNIPPTVTITYPINGATLTSPASVEITAAATDNIGVKQVEFYANSISGGNVLLGTDTNSPYRFKSTIVRADTYTLTAKAYDTAGNSRISTSVTIEVIK